MGTGFSGRADSEASWGRSGGQPPPQERFRGGPPRGFAGGVPSDEGSWARGGTGQRQAAPRRLADDAQWGRGGGQPPAQLAPQNARSDEEQRWSRTLSSQALKPMGDECPPQHAVYLSDDWKRDQVKSNSVLGAGSGTGSAAGASDRHAPLSCYQISSSSCKIIVCLISHLYTCKRHLVWRSRMQRQWNATQVMLGG
jgi:hypothetical protein